MKLAHYLKTLLLCLVLNLVACATQQPPGEAESLDTSGVDDRRKPIDLIINGDYVEKHSKLCFLFNLRFYFSGMLIYYGWC